MQILCKFLNYNDVCTCQVSKFAINCLSISSTLLNSVLEALYKESFWLRIRKFVLVKSCAENKK